MIDEEDKYAEAMARFFAMTFVAMYIIFAPSLVYMFYFQYGIWVAGSFALLCSTSIAIIYNKWRMRDGS